MGSRCIPAASLNFLFRSRAWFVAEGALFELRVRKTKRAGQKRPALLSAFFSCSTGGNLVADVSASFREPLNKSAWAGIYRLFCAYLTHVPSHSTDLFRVSLAGFFFPTFRRNSLSPRGLDTRPRCPSTASASLRCHLQSSVARHSELVRVNMSALWPQCRPAGSGRWMESGAAI